MVSDVESVRVKHWIAPRPWSAARSRNCPALDKGMLRKASAQWDSLTSTILLHRSGCKLLLASNFVDSYSSSHVSMLLRLFLDLLR